MKIRRMMVATDFSQCSVQATEYAVALAADLGAKLFLIHAVEPVYFAGAFYGPDASVPMLTEEQRRYAEEARVSVRNCRRDSNDALKKMEKDKSISQDELKKAHSHVQEITDKEIKGVDEVLSRKENEIMEV